MAASHLKRWLFSLNKQHRGHKSRSGYRVCFMCLLKFCFMYKFSEYVTYLFLVALAEVASLQGPQRQALKRARVQALEGTRALKKPRGS